MISQREIERLSEELNVSKNTIDKDWVLGHFIDIWYLSKNYELDTDKIVKAFKKKVKYKNLEFTGIEQLINPRHEKILKHNWKNSLEHQIPKGALMDYTIVIPEVRDFFENIF